MFLAVFASPISLLFLTSLNQWLFSNPTSLICSKKWPYFEVSWLLGLPVVYNQSWFGAKAAGRRHLSGLLIADHESGKTTLAACALFQANLPYHLQEGFAVWLSFLGEEQCIPHIGTRVFFCLRIDQSSLLWSFNYFILFSFKVL